MTQEIINQIDIALSISQGNVLLTNVLKRIKELTKQQKASSVVVSEIRQRKSRKNKQNTTNKGISIQCCGLKTRTKEKS